jgi:glycosyltransferase involved in cell wall biosynthesis
MHDHAALRGAGPRPILHVIDCLRTGGTERQMLELLRYLDRDRYRPIVACFQRVGELEEELVRLGVPIFQFPLLGTLLRFNTAVQVNRLAALCRRERIQIVHAHDLYSNLIGVLSARLAGVPVIASRRDLGHWIPRLQQRALRVSLRLSSCVLANAEAVAQVAHNKEAVSKKKLWVVQNGIDWEAFASAAAREPSPPLPSKKDGAIRVAMVGSMFLPDKGHRDLLQTATLLSARGRKINWLLISDGALRPSLEAERDRLGLSGSVHFIGRRQDVPSILQRSDLLVHPSWSEGFPNVILEAMCAGLPVVATTVGGCPELVDNGHTGLLVEPKRPDLLAEAVDRIISQPVLARTMGERARDRVRERFSVRRLCRRVESLYDELLGE